MKHVRRAALAAGLTALLLLLGGCIMSFRQGQGMGREACSISKSIARGIDVVD